MQRLQSFIAIALLIVPFAPIGQTAIPEADVEAVLEQMTPEERVGQLFLVTFYGSDTTETSEIGRLISDYHVGGVVLLEENNNFLSGPGDLLDEQILALTTNLQDRAVPSEESEAVYIPLLIGIELDGGSYSILAANSEKLTPLPSSMAIGATWNPDNALRAGEIAGEELAALGINMMIGPYADVTDDDQIDTPGNQDVATFGGDAFWVSEMTEAYITGAHIGSNGRMLVVPRHFPGFGGADRPVTDEIPIVPRTEDQLAQTDLQPFFRVTGQAVDPLAAADGLLTGHVRYRGFQGDNARQPSPPISLDSQALGVLLQLEDIAVWHDSGGLIISDSLGEGGVKRFYDYVPGERFRNREIALDAFDAGNDMLYLSSFGPNQPAATQTDTIIDTIEYFVDQYKQNPAFRERTDEAVRRILTKKLELYGDFDPQLVETNPVGLDELAPRTDEFTLPVASSAVSLLAPASPEGITTPERDQQIVIFTDTRTASLCDSCPATPIIPRDRLQAALLRSYGPDAAGIISLADINSFTFDQLRNFLDFVPVPLPEDEPTPQPSDLELALDVADWVIFVMLDNDSASGSVVSDFLAEPPTPNGTQYVVMAMGPPYYLDSTEVSKLTAYYGLYDSSEPFVTVAARTLFAPETAVGSSPVTVPGIDYSIQEVVQPDPSRVIKLTVSRDEDFITPQPQTATPQAELPIDIGDTIFIRAGTIQDRNGNPVPDGTPVDFVFNYVTDGRREVIPDTTENGIAQIEFTKEFAGSIVVTAESPPAANSDSVRITEDTLEIVQPTPQITEEPDPTDTPEPTPEPAQQTPTPAAVDQEPDPPARSVSITDFVVALTGVSGIALAIFFITASTQTVNDALLVSLPAMIGGLIGYNYYALFLYRSDLWNRVFQQLSASSAAWAGAFVGFVVIRLLVFVAERQSTRRRRSGRGEGR
ncbi:MAG: hypothetical protein GYB64_14750 [Chloroflexi bacterium]|nr:hypothetical protein [Chloroflexota bacterium]